ncbi:hypothetical protein [Gorillibacterium sp. sgz5001074]|uniref:hypothetical protein n=1 Tax=Gorillibacterium sp. sgz5001074 TaxID=3446695 RepID=UPI003F674E13
MEPSRWRGVLRNPVFWTGFVLLAASLPMIAPVSGTYPTLFSLLYPYFTLVMGVPLLLTGLFYELWIKDR